MHQVDTELFTFVEKYATTLLRWDLLLHFGSTPDSSQTAEQVANQLSRNVRATSAELEKLAYQRVLCRRNSTSDVTYRLSRRPRVRRPATRLAGLMKDPTA